MSNVLEADLLASILLFNIFQNIPIIPLTTVQGVYTGNLEQLNAPFRSIRMEGIICDPTFQRGRRVFYFSTGGAQ